MKQRISISVGALALLVTNTAYGVPDACDDGRGEFIGDILFATEFHGSWTGQQDDAVGRAMVVGDFNGDGIGDLAFGAEGRDDNGPASGAVYVILSPNGDLAGSGIKRAWLDADVVIRGASAYDRSGFALANAGDVDGDGTDDLLVGANATAGASGGAGIAHLVLGDTISSDTEIDLLLEAEATFYGNFGGDLFGNAVAGVGDVNADGYADVLIGAPKHSSVHYNGGAAYLWLGPISGDQFAGSDETARFDAAVQKGSFGVAVAGLGDVNNDGFADFGIGAPADATAASNAGAFYTWFGGSSFSASESAAAADLRMYGRQNNRFGASAAIAGDIDGDDRDDFWIGAKQRGAFKQGAAYLMRGTSTAGVAGVGEVIAHHSVLGVGANDLVGSAVGAGDFNRDGIPDVAIGGERGAGQVAGSGAAWILYGPFVAGATTSLTTYDAKILGTAFENFVGSVIAVGDTNNDDYDDLFVGGWKSSDGLLRGGKVALWQGGADVADLVSYYRDSDNDGYGNVAITQLACSEPGGFVGNSDDCNDGNAAYRPSAPEACDGNDYNCDGVTGAVDNDLDGYFACAATNADCDDNVASINPGRDEVCFSGGQIDGIDNDCDGLVDDSTAVDAQEFYPDVDGDGYGDNASRVDACTAPPFASAIVNIGGDCNDTNVQVSPNAAERCFDAVDNDCNGNIDDGAAFDARIWYQDLDNDGDGNARVTTTACNQPSGFSAFRGDCDDSASLVVVGATESCDFFDNDCSGLNYLGGPESTDRALGTFLGRGAGDALSPGGFLPDQDFDGDDEMILVSQSADEGASNGGAVYIVRGRYNIPTRDFSAPTASGGTNPWDVRIIGTRINARFGSAIGVGDFNGDGIGDLAVGSSGARVPNVDQGGVYVFYGPIQNGTFTAEEANLIIKGEFASDFFGGGVAVGNFNGDLYDDILVSAIGHSATSFRKQGKVFLMYGASNGLGGGNLSVTTLVDASFTGLSQDDEAGSALGSLGDVDGDGFDDFAIGANKVGATDTGAVYIKYGSGVAFSGAITADAIINGRQQGDRFGFSVGGAGDVNADDYDDIIFGTATNQAFLTMGGATRLSGDIGVQSITQVRFIGSFAQRAGRFVSGIGDVNDDGNDDFALSATDDDGIVQDGGAAFIVYGTTVARLEEVTPRGGDFLLDRVESFGRLPPGQYFPTYSATNYTVLEGAKVSGQETAATFGSVVGGGDFDADGVPDLLMGAPGADKSGLSTDHGKVFFFPGGPYGVDVFVTDSSDVLWYWDYDADTFSDIGLSTFRACEMHRPISFRNPAVPVPRGLLAPTADLDCDDRDYTIYPGAPEAPGVDGEDTDCDGYDVPNILPEITVEIDPDAPLQTDTLFADVTIVDEDPIYTPITLQFTWYRNGTVIAGQNASTLLPNYFQAGDTITVEVLADDTRGTTEFPATDTVTIENTPPYLSDCTITPTNVGVTNDLTAGYSGLADDDFADAPFLTVAYKWQKLQQGTFWFDIPGQTGSGLESCYDRNVPLNDPQAQLVNCTVGDFIRLTCTPRDPTGAGTTVPSTPVQIQNSAPVAESCVVTPVSPRTNDQLTVTPAGSDVDGDAVTMNYAWFVNGLPVGATTQTLAGVTYFDHFDNVQVECTPVDSRGLAGSPILSAPITVLNTAPTQPVIALLPLSPRSNQDISVSIVSASTDVDVDPIAYQYRWQRNGVPFNNPTYPTNVSFVLEGNTFKGDVWNVTATPTDGYDFGPAASASVTILNTPPTVDGVVVSPTPSATRPETREILTAIPVNFYDHDGDPNLSRVDWYVNGLLEYTGPSLAPGYAARGDIVYVVYTPYDGETFGTSATSAVFTMRNSPPEAIVLSAMEPFPAGEFDDIECNWVGPSTDYDADSVTYTVQFYANRPTDPFANPPSGSALVLLQAYSSVTLSPGDAFKWILPDTGAVPNTPAALTDAVYGDQIFCRVTPNDGTVDGPSTDANPVTIQDLNAPPSPLINQIERYRNADTVTLAGTCADFPTECGDLFFECVNNVGGYLHSADPDQGLAGACINDVFTQQVTLTRGYDWTCWSYCVDTGGNRSINSNTRATQVCGDVNPAVTTHDVYELRGESVGDSIATAVDDWSSFQDDTPASISFTGNIIGTGVEFSDSSDYFLVRTSDNPSDDDADGENNYNTEVRFSSGSSAYNVIAYRHTGGDPSVTSVQQCPLQPSGYDSFNFYAWDRGDYTHPDHGTTYLADRQRCDRWLSSPGTYAPGIAPVQPPGLLPTSRANSVYNDCEDFTSNYYVRVLRSSGNDCTHYTVEVANEDPTWP